MSEKSSTFAPAFEKRTPCIVPRDVNQQSVCGPKSVEQGENSYERFIATRIEP